jgi:hypothetical protein
MVNLHTKLNSEKRNLLEEYQQHSKTNRYDYRCGVNGHLADDCKVILCIYCESAKHPAKECPLLSMPKPTAITYGLTRSELLFYEAPASSNIYFKHDSGKVGRVCLRW